MSARYPHIVKKVMPAVVSIAISKALHALEREIPSEVLPFLPFEGSHLKVPDAMLDAKGRVQIGGGSGFFVRSDGTILTNKHVIIGSEVEYTIILDDARRFPARVLARDPVDDIAILKIDSATEDSKKFPFLQFGDSANLQLGEEVLAFGNALGMFRSTVSRGIVSGLSRSLWAAPDPQKPKQEMRGLIQTDAAINPGNSGGPLVNLKGRVIGINTAVVSGAQNVGFAIPINAAKRDLYDLEHSGRIRRPLLGVRYLPVDDRVRAKMNLAVDYGAIVVGQLPDKVAVVRGSPADKAGLREQDIILECDGKQINTDFTIQDVLEGKEANDELKLKVLRGGEELEIKLTLTERK